MKEIVGELDCIKTKNFCYQEDEKKQKTKHTDWEIILAKDISDK